MKKLFLLAVLALIGVQSFAQTSVIDKFFQKYSNDESFTIVSISPKMFGMFAKVDASDPDTKKAMEVVQKLKSLRILAKDNAKNGSQLYHEAAAFLTKDYEELMTVRSDGNDVKFLIKENAQGNIQELVMLVGGSDSFVAMSLVGDIDLNQISKMAGTMNITGMDNLKLAKKSTH